MAICGLARLQKTKGVSPATDFASYDRYLLRNAWEVSGNWKISSMNRKGLALSATLLTTVGAVSAIAAAGVHHRGGGDGGWHQSHMGKGHGFHRGGKRHGKMGRMIRLKQRDADNDGTVTLDEFLKPRADKFAKIDANGDGMLDRAELTARMRECSGQRQRMMMVRLDVDGDGQVTKEEFEKSAGRHRWGKRGRCGRDRYRGHGDRGRGMGRMGDEAAMDRDRGPGKRAERRAERQAKRFARMDANGDGVITAADLEARSAERIGWFQKKLHVLDKDSDGKVSREEFTARAQQRFADLDLHKDGKITIADLPPGMATRWEKKSAPKGDAGEADDKGAK